jgi:hypothetical protein
MLRVAIASAGDLWSFRRATALSYISLTTAIVSPVIRIINRINFGRETAPPAAGDSAAIPLPAAIFPLQLPANSAVRWYEELALNLLKTRNNSADRVTLFPRLQAISPATAVSASSRSNVQERG